MTESDASPPSAASAPSDEFAHVPSPKRRVPWLPLGVVALSCFLVLHERRNVSYALSSATPTDLGEAAALRVEGAPRNRFVRVRGTPDRESALLFDTQGSWEFTQFFRLRGTSSQVFVHRRPDPLPVPLAESDAYVGRLVRLADMPYDESLRAHYAKHVTATHVFEPTALHAALASGQRNIKSRAGDPVAFDGGLRVAFDLARPDEWEVSVPKSAYPDLARARARLGRDGATLLDVPSRDVRFESTHHLFVARLPSDPKQRDGVLSALADIDGGVRVHPARSPVEALARDVSATAEGFTFARVISGTTPASVPPSAVLSVRAVSAVDVPADALLLLEGERPRDHLKSVVVTGFLVAFALLNLLALRRAS